MNILIRAKPILFVKRGWLCLTMAAFLLAHLPCRGAGSSESISFRNDVMAVLSKAGCNAGACHGNANGKAGFKLSLRGEDGDLDFKALTRDMFGRRTEPADPDQSLILLKATMQLAHEGGQRFKKDSDEYRILQGWIAAGTPQDLVNAPALKRLEVSPADRIVIEPDEEVRVQVRAIFSDGSSRDVTKMAVYEAANGLAKVSPDGLVTREGMGETTVLVRYLHAQVPVRLAFVPARPNFLWKNPASNNYIDEHIFAKLRTLRLNPSDLCADNDFIRRAYLDLLGLVPTAEEARAFVNDDGVVAADVRRRSLTSPRVDDSASHRRLQKRARLIDQLLERPEFADFWALKWGDLLRAEERLLDRKGIETFQRWIRQSIAEHKPLDQFARELIAARGSTYQNPPANFYRAIRDPVGRGEAVAQVFLGTRLQCAQCHNHPFDKWTQDDYYDWAGLFARVNYKVLENRRRDNNDGHEFKGEQIIYVANKGEVKNPRKGKPAEPRFLGQPQPVSEQLVGSLAPPTEPTESAVGRGYRRAAVQSDSDRDELDALAAWITSPDNPFFARAQVNRIWFHLMGRGIVDPIDDFRATNPASHPALLDALAADFVKHKFDLRHIIRLIMNSRTYQ
ncbi:MAG: hypothetical protein DME26_06190, partial [Verrucomicrobia bacterium]